MLFFFFFSGLWCSVTVRTTTDVHEKSVLHPPPSTGSAGLAWAVAPKSAVSAFWGCLIPPIVLATAVSAITEFAGAVSASELKLDAQPDEVFYECNQLDGFPMGAVLAAGPYLPYFSDEGLFDVILDNSWGNQPGIFGEVHHVMRFGGDVPEQLLILFGSFSHGLHQPADILCRNVVCFTFILGEKHASAVVELVELKHVFNEHVHVDMVILSDICQIHVGDDLEERHCLPCVRRLDLRAMEGRISFSSTKIVFLKFVNTRRDLPSFVETFE